MKMKKYLSTCAVVGIAALLFVGCSDYDNGYNENAIKFTEDFKSAYGDIDPEQDWNLAERASVTVSTQKESNIKIYAINGNEFSIVGDYEGVKGTRVLGIDLVEDTRILYVSDGSTAQKCAPGDVVIFGQDTRTTYSGNGTVEIEKLTSPITIGETTYPVYKYATTEAELEALKAVVPEGEVNLKMVTHDFTFVSNGDFIIYPYYWVTSSRNTIGLYYYDSNGEKVEVDIYTAKEANDGDLGELTYEDAYDGSTLVIDEDLDKNPPANIAGGDSRKWPEDWTIDNGTGVGNFHYNGWSTEQDASGMVTPFIEYWRGTGNNLESGTINRQITGLEPGNYIVELDVRLFNEHRSTVPSGVTFFANGKTIVLSDYCTQADYDDGKELYGHLYINVVTVNSDGVLNLGFTMNGVQGDWLSFKNLKVSKMGTWKTAVDQGKNTVRRSQGIHVQIPAGTKFGMYLKKGDIDNPSYEFYSVSELNDPSKVGPGIEFKNTDGTGDTSKRLNWTSNKDIRPCHASTFYVGDQMFLGFEDWPNDADQSDFDLNDLVLAFDGEEPTIINEDPEVTSCWLLVCEDLGGSFDTDYNDVIFKVEHVSGQTIAKVTPMAAGGTLASYIVFNDPTTGATTSDYVVGEIHQLFGVSSQPSGEYDPINVYSRWERSGATVEIPVHENWTIAYNVDDVSYTYDNLSNNGYKGANMGGFYILTQTTGTQVKANPSIGDLSSSKSSVIAAPGKGDAPYILCLPYTYTKDEDGKRNTYVWAWPKELCTICAATYSNGKYSGANGGAYLEFGDWVSEYESHKDWYKNRDENSITVELWKLSSQDISDINKNDSQLGNKGNMVITAGETPDFYNNLTGTSTGAITYHLDTPNGTVWTAGGLYNTGERMVYVTQAADANTKEGTTSFMITVKPQSDDTKIYGIAFTLQIGGQQETSIYKFDADNGSVEVTANMGDYFWIHSKNPAVSWTSEYHRDDLTATYNDNSTTITASIGTNKNNWNNAIGFEVTRWGYQTITLYAPENDLYKEQTVKINVNVTGKVIMKSSANGNDYALALKDGELRTVPYNANDENQKWYVEGTVDANGKLQSYGNLLNLRNVATNQYIAFDSDRNLQLMPGKPAATDYARYIEEADGDKFKYMWGKKGDAYAGYYLGILGDLGQNWNNWPTGLVYENDTPDNVCKFTMVVVP